MLQRSNKPQQRWKSRTKICNLQSGSEIPDLFNCNQWITLHNLKDCLLLKVSDNAAAKKQ